ncbi:electron transport complex protein RnfC [Trichococcus patagoniensis]|uniref:Ion-translocating oxidoreductase complex subunit C n=1 Tax=Trichococcus patagoniensis TaxID=382641 RepID=A0A2T5IJD8_9LACT|nr:electron transport complex subunit RsxC [Trichococcus patagoniensis]PTQ83937.1 electron transport complex protein RnfC [Trichococcus patagoniensis]
MFFSIKRTLKGSHPDPEKSRTENKEIEVASVPRTLIFPLNMHIGAPAKPVVAVGEAVKVGTLLAAGAEGVSANVHASVSGIVTAIEKRLTVKGLADCIVIKNDEAYETESWPGHTEESLTKEDILKAIKDAGIVGMGGAQFPTHIKYAVENPDSIHTLILNGAECEPYATADDRLMREHPLEILQGMALIKRLFPIEQAVVGIESNKPEAILKMEEAAKGFDDIVIQSLPDLYPQGDEETLIVTVSGKQVPAGKLPKDIGVIVSNVATAYAVQQAVYSGNPLITRVVTVTGTPLKEPKNLLVRIGTPIQSVLDDCGGFAAIPGAIIHGGPMMGRAVEKTAVPIVKGTSIILTQTLEEAGMEERMPCIRCAQCLEVCPVKLQPVLISEAYERGNIKRAEELGAMDCIECGNCSYICPSKIPLLDHIRGAKQRIREQQKAGVE